ncbi:hypothetical protein Taro_008093 [Colocasia esculenta]|uniref:N-alpha-acetyltransferase 40 n=1 Tax=Colocasia esculenta TaxID=4460 RepID=A0A843U263_COLES|nr:hypothetical protein [Colocasia esculenta]
MAISNAKLATGLSLYLESGSGIQLSSPIKRYIQTLLKVNMERPYGAEWPIEEKVKRQEMVAPEARYIFIRKALATTPSTDVARTEGDLSHHLWIDDGDRVVGFVHYRFIVEEDIPVVYVYELQLESSVQGKGLGKFLMQLIELIALKNHMEAVMLTVQKANELAMNFYMSKLRYVISSISPSRVDPLIGTGESYEILCKTFDNDAKIILEISPSCSSPAPLNLLSYLHRGCITTAAMFGVVFPGRSFHMDVSSFRQIDPFHWVLDINTFVGIALPPPPPCPPGKALAVYAQAHGAPYAFCGAVHATHPSALLHLPWPDPHNAAAQGPHNARIGVSVEDLSAMPAVADAGSLAGGERLALRVGDNLFNFMQSFCGVDGGRLVVPADVLDWRFNKFQERVKRDSDYLNSFISS